MTLRSGFEWDDSRPTPSSGGLMPDPPRLPPPSPVTPAVRVRPRKAEPRLSLRAMREATRKTQAEVAAALGTEQGEVSRIERREDVRLSTLRRYAVALGAECEVVFVFPKTGHRITLADPQ